MSSQRTIEDPGFNLDIPPSKDLDESATAPLLEPNPHSIHSASHASQSAPGYSKGSQNGKEDKGRVTGQPHQTEKRSSEELLQLLNQLRSEATQRTKDAERTENIIEHAIKLIEELKEEMSDVGKTKATTQGSKLEEGTLKRRYRGHPPVGDVRSGKKRARVA